MPAHSFQRVDNPDREFNGILVEDPLFIIRGWSFRHEIPVMAYALEEAFHINIDKAALNARGLPVGPGFPPSRNRSGKGFLIPPPLRYRENLMAWLN